MRGSNDNKEEKSEKQKCLEKPEREERHATALSEGESPRHPTGTSREDNGELHFFYTILDISSLIEVSIEIVPIAGFSCAPIIGANRAAIDISSRFAGRAAFCKTYPVTVACRFAFPAPSFPGFAAAVIPEICCASAIQAPTCF
ncbi:MAG: hypothetical protein RBT70_10110 [Alphaproteobacteria bacterium]|jgi:hypothetical protein|nr:hypothetical protein [Alphaproteobacteria bacterium]